MLASLPPRLEGFDTISVLVQLCQMVNQQLTDACGSAALPRSGNAPNPPAAPEFECALHSRVEQRNKSGAKSVMWAGSSSE